MGIITMRNENWAIELFFTPSIRPVEIVVPERDSPGSTAHACDRPIMKASRKLTSLPGSFPSAAALRA